VCPPGGGQPGCLAAHGGGPHFPQRRHVLVISGLIAPQPGSVQNQRAMRARMARVQVSIGGCSFRLRIFWVAARRGW
jgi:hypothetical protein